MASNDSDPRSIVDRRKFLKASGAATTAGMLAGCSGGGDGGDGGGDGGDGGGSDGGDGGGSDGEMEDTDTPTKTATEEEGWTPSQDVTAIVPYGTGGGYNFYTRNLATTLQENFLDVAVNVKNITGGGGLTGINQLYNADNPNHTIGILNTESHALGQIARPEASNYDIREFTYYPRVAGTTRAIAVFTDATDVRTLRPLLKGTMEGNIKWANQGPQSTNAIQIKALGALGDITIDGQDFTLEDYENNAVTFGGRGEELTAAKRGDIQATAGSYSSLFKFVKSDDLRTVLVYTSEDSCPSSARNSDCATFKTTDVDISNTSQINAISGGPFHRLFIGHPDTSSEAADFWCETIEKAIKHEDFQQRAEEADRPIKFGDCELSRQGAIGTYETYNSQKDLLRQLGLL